jgi:hypothetical protein
MSVEQRSLDEVVLAYIEAWNTPDQEARRNLLDRCWTDDATYIDPASEVQGKDALVAHIGGFLSGERHGLGAGCRIPMSSGVEHHHGMIRFTWVLLNPEGVPVSRGLDLGELAADGRLQRITGFLDLHGL